MTHKKKKKRSLFHNVANFFTSGKKKLAQWMPQEVEIQWRKLEPTHNFTLVLGGGSARGIIHIGVLKYLDEKGIYPKEICGTSAGAIAGAGYALGISGLQLEQLMANFVGADFPIPKFSKALYQLSKLQDYLDKIYGKKKFSHTNIPLKVIATDLNSGEKVIMTQGNVAKAVKASAGIPVVFTPVTINKKILADGGITCNLPIESGTCNNVVACSCLGNLESEITIKKPHKSKIKNWVNSFSNNKVIMLRSVSLLIEANEHKSLSTDKNTVLLRPNLEGIQLDDFSKYERLIEIGYQEAKKILARKVNKRKIS